MSKIKANPIRPHEQMRVLRQILKDDESAVMLAYMSCYRKITGDRPHSTLRLFTLSNGGFLLVPSVRSAVSTTLKKQSEIRITGDSAGIMSLALALIHVGHKNKHAQERKDHAQGNANMVYYYNALMQYAALSPEAYKMKRIMGQYLSSPFWPNA